MSEEQLNDLKKWRQIILLDITNLDRPSDESELIRITKTRKKRENNKNDTNKKGKSNRIQNV